MKVVANKRNEQGTGASRRLRRAGKVPGIIYGGQGEPARIEVDHNSLYHALRVESFHSSILDLDLDGSSEQVLLRAVQWHPYKPQVMHIDFQRIDADHVITMRVPVHFMNQEISPAVKLGGAMISHV
ncbi:MAG: 50S ribosomal protein L25/general stress protein Ctc, partial [Quisquiliibacterium sp.]